MDRLSFNGVDLSGYVANTELAHGPDDADKDTRRDSLIAGLAQASMTISGTWEADMSSFAAMFANDYPDRAIEIGQPDGRWQAIKARLARWWPLRRLKVRWLVYTTRGLPQVDPHTGVITVSTTAPVTVSIVTRRGRP